LAPPAGELPEEAQLPASLSKNLEDYLPFTPPEEKTSSFLLPGTTPVLPAGYAETFQPRFFKAGLEVYGLGQAVLLGLLAGFILNFMPCVLPVVTLKLGTLAGLGGLKSLGAQNINDKSGYHRQTRRRLRTYGLFFSLGVLVWFAALFAIIGFAGMLWGQFFQSDKLILFLAMILFLLALSLLNVFRLPLLHVEYENVDPKLQKNHKAAPGKLPRQAFFGGLLATLMATPCSGPLLGGVLSWAVGEPLPFLALALGSVGLGMASPFLLLGLKPGLARFLPQPGAWNVALERIMAFLLLGTVLYLLSMLPADKLVQILYALLLLGIAAWLWGRRTLFRRPGAVLATAASALLAALALYSALAYQKAEQYAQGSPDSAWQHYTPELFSAALGRENILLDFTADWCINCRAMEATTLSGSNRTKWLEEYRLTYMQADLTRENIPAETLLRALGSAGIPVIAIFPAGNGFNAPVVLRDISTTSQVEEALRFALR
jgi:thiol:disulfide interchange protein DsbD